MKENEEYLLTIHIDADYLSDPKTVYPIRIDPTIEINYSGSGASAIEDVTINSTGGSDGSSGSLRVGKRETYGISRILMKFPTLSAYTNVPSEQVVKASVEIRDIICESDALEISCYQFTGNTWNESTANWSNVNPNSIGALLSSNTVSYANGVALTNRHRYSFDITSAVLSWKTNTTLFSKGIVFKASSAVENGSTYISKTFSSYERSSNQPSLSIIYTNPFYSTFAESEGFYDSGNSDLQYRSNCYGYALRMFYGGDAMPIYEPLYKQQPGEFADKTSGLTIESDITLTYWSARNLDLLGYEEYFGPDASRHSDANRLDYIYKLVKADMDTLGYTVIDATSAALTADITPNRRLCLEYVWRRK